MAASVADSSSTESKLKCVAWTPYVIDGKKFIGKYIFLQKSYSLMISDLVHLYYEELSESEIQQRCEDLNPGLEMSSERMIKQIKKSVEDCLSPGGPADIRNTVSVAKQSQQHLELKVESYVAQILFVWFFSLDAMKPSSVSTYLLLPLIGMAAELKRRNHELIQVIKNKDAEIEDYKTNGAKVTRKRLETKPFIESDFVADMDRSEYLLEGLKDPTKSALCDSLYCTVTSAQENLKRKIKETEEIERNAAVKRLNTRREADCQEVINIDSGMEDRKEEMKRRNLLEQQLDSKNKKKGKKKAFKL